MPFLLKMVEIIINLQLLHYFDSRDSDIFLSKKILGEKKKREKTMR